MREKKVAVVRLGRHVRFDPGDLDAYIESGRGSSVSADEHCPDAVHPVPSIDMSTDVDGAVVDIAQSSGGANFCATTVSSPARMTIPPRNQPV